VLSPPLRLLSFLQQSDERLALQELGIRGILVKLVLTWNK
jgi:hypothetical protein